MKDIELTILMPCLNEEETLEKCIKIADNGSTDRSIAIANANGVRVINVPVK